MTTIVIEVRFRRCFDPLRQMVEGKLADWWSPAQISRWLARTYPGVEEMHVSHETIHLTLFIHARGGLKRELTQHLRTRRTNRQPCHRRAFRVGIEPVRCPKEHRSALPTAPVPGLNRVRPGVQRAPLRCKGGSSFQAVPGLCAARCNDSLLARVGTSCDIAKLVRPDSASY